MVFTYRKAKKFAQRLEAAKAAGTFPDVIMPNGKKYNDCSREEIDGFVVSMEKHAEVHEKAARLVPLWTLLQIAMIVWIVYLYTTDKEMGRNATLGHIVLFATLVAFGSIWLLARAAYWLIYVYCRFAGRGAARGVTNTVSTGQTNGLDDDLGKLTSERVIKIGRGTQLWWREPLKWWDSSIWSVMFSMVFFIAVAWGLALLIDDIRWRLLVGVAGTIVCLVMPGGRNSIRWLWSSQYRKQWREYRRGGPPPGGPVFRMLDYRAHELYWRFFLLPARILGFVLTCVAIVAAIFIAQSTSYSPLVKILIAFVAFQAIAAILQMIMSAINWLIRSVFFELIDVVPAHGTDAEEALAIVKFGHRFEVIKKFETEIENWTVEDTDEFVKLLNWRARLFFPVKARFENEIPELKRIHAETGKEPRDIGPQGIDEIRSQFPGTRITWLENAITSPRIFYATLVFVLIVVVISFYPLSKSTGETEAASDVYTPPNLKARQVEIAAIEAEIKRRRCLESNICRKYASARLHCAVTSDFQNCLHLNMGDDMLEPGFGCSDDGKVEGIRLRNMPSEKECQSMPKEEMIRAQLGKEKRRRGHK